MEVKPLCLCLLLLLALLCLSLAKKQTCLTSAYNCEECIQSGPECAWCMGPRSDVRCNTVERLQRAGCRNITYPQGRMQVVKNGSSTAPLDAGALFLQPQELSLHLRPGLSQSFPVIITAPTDQPITELTMDTSGVPAGVTITMRHVTSGNPQVIQVKAEAFQCPSESDGYTQSNNTGPWFVHITPRGFSQSVKLEITLQCQCDCSRHREENSSDCSGRGVLVCGWCRCNAPYIGRQCDSSVESILAPSEDDCRSTPGAPVCSGRGACVDGFCECNRRENPKEKYSGTFCQCSNFDCAYHNNRMCGGNGRCRCGRCICNAGWTGEACGCSADAASCVAQNQMLCNNRGTCECGSCKCEPPYAGPTCETCPTCPNRCQQHAACVECRAFGTGGKKYTCDHDCGYLSVTTVETRSDLPQPGNAISSCKMKSSADACSFYYTLSSTPSGVQSLVVQTRECSPN